MFFRKRNDELKQMAKKENTKTIKKLDKLNKMLLAKPDATIDIAKAVGGLR